MYYRTSCRDARRVLVQDKQQGCMESVDTRQAAWIQGECWYMTSAGMYGECYIA